MSVEQELSKNHICYKCIEDPFLKKEIISNGEKIKCTYCMRKAIGYPIAKFADRISEAFLTHFERSPDQPSDYEYYRQFAEEDSSYFWAREGEELVDILQDQMGFPEKLQLILQNFSGMKITTTRLLRWVKNPNLIVKHYMKLRVSVTKNGSRNGKTSRIP